jgi:hypothetical protein
MMTRAIGQAMTLIQAVCIFWSPDSVMSSARGFMIGSAILTFALSRSQLSIGGGPYFWSPGSYTVGNGTWKGHLRTNQHTSFADPFVRLLFVGPQRVFGDVRRRPG